ncbi:MAG: exosortase-associated EpsI family protein [Verrucomicrobiota bacterium]
MKKIKPRLVWAALATALVLGALWQFVPLPDASARLQSLPENPPGVQTRPEPLAPGEVEIFSRTNVIKRLALVEGQTVMLTVIDGTRNRHAIHDPRFCFQGAGWKIVAQDPIPLNKGEASRVKLEKDGETTEAVFWFTDGVRQFSSPATYWTKTTLRRLTFGRSGGEPVLVILAASAGAPMDWPKLLQTWSALGGL